MRSSPRTTQASAPPTRSELIPDEPPTSEFRFDGIIHSSTPVGTSVRWSASTKHTVAKERT